MEACFATIYHPMPTRITISVAQSFPLILLIVWQGKYQDSIGYSLGHTFERVHQNPFSGQRQELLGHITTHARATATGHYYNIFFESHTSTFS
jgi:hypothetical protein